MGADGNAMTVRTVYDGEFRTVVAEPEFTPANETETTQENGRDEQGDAEGSETTAAADRPGIAEPSQEGKVSQLATAAASGAPKAEPVTIKTAPAPVKKTEAQIQQDLIAEAQELGMTGTVPPDFEA